RWREPDGAVLLLPAAQPAGAPRARDDGRIPERRVGHAQDGIRGRPRELSGHGGRVVSGVSAGRAGGGPGRTALVPGLAHLTAARGALALEPRLTARLGRRRRLRRGRDDRGGPTRLPRCGEGGLTPWPPLRDAERGGGNDPGHHRGPGPDRSAERRARGSARRRRPIARIAGPPAR